MKETSTGMGLIVFIDDDGGVMEFYEEALREAGYEIERIHKLPKALQYIQSTTDEPILWLVDVMMPVIDDTFRVDGELLSSASSRGLASGRLLYRQIRKRFSETPVILLTSVPSSQILNDLEAEMDGNAICESKLRVEPDDLVALVARFGQSKKSNKYGSIN